MRSDLQYRYAELEITFSCFDVHTVHCVLFVIHTNECTNICIKTFYKYSYMVQCFCTIVRAVPCFRWLVAGLSLRRPGFDASPVQFRFVVHKVALGRVNPENGAEAVKHVGVLIKHFNIYVCAFIGLNNK